MISPEAFQGHLDQSKPCIGKVIPRNKNHGSQPLVTTCVPWAQWLRTSYEGWPQLHV